MSKNDTQLGAACSYNFRDRNLIQVPTRLAEPTSPHSPINLSSVPVETTSGKYHFGSDVRHYSGPHEPCVGQSPPQGTSGNTIGSPFGQWQQLMPTLSRSTDRRECRQIQPCSAEIYPSKDTIMATTPLESGQGLKLPFHRKLMENQNATFG